jgi:hypothetical protein
MQRQESEERFVEAMKMLIPCRGQNGASGEIASVQSASTEAHRESPHLAAFASLFSTEAIIICPPKSGA